MRKTINEAMIKKAVKDFPTPFYLYDESGIQKAAQTVNMAFKWDKNYKNFFAVKALPNPAILKIVLSEGMGLDCSSLTELMLAEKVGASGHIIMFSSNDTGAEEFKKAKDLGAIINLDDITHLSFLETVAGLPDLLCFRYNPGRLVKGNTIIGHPEEAKFGMTRDQVIEAVTLAKQKGVKRFGLHAMVISNNLDVSNALDIVTALFKLADDIHETLGISFEFINLGGGIGIPYKPDQMSFDVDEFSSMVQRHMTTMLSYTPTIYTELGRYITGPYGFLVSQVLHIKRTYKTFIGLDASMHNLMRPGMYGAYHHITILGKQDAPLTETYDVTGSLCENNDKFAIDRQLPKIAIGDIVVLHDAGAHAHTMGFNYNGKLRSAEVLAHADGSLQLIRRAETPDDYFATLV